MKNIPGKDNVEADYLSRLVVDSEIVNCAMFEISWVK